MLLGEGKWREERKGRGANKALLALFALLAFLLTGARWEVARGTRGRGANNFSAPHSQFRGGGEGWVIVAMFANRRKSRFILS